MADENGTVAKRPKGRSPAYPAINLETAIQRARQLHARERQHPTPVATIAAHWNYKSLNGPGSQTLAALKKYGLIEDEGAGSERKARLSELADVILAHPDGEHQQAAIREAALRPAMHRELWEKYHDDLPSDRNLRWELTHERGFTETGAHEFIPVYKATVSFARLADHVAGPVQDHDGQGAEDYDREDDEAQPEPEVRQQDDLRQGRRGPASSSMSYPIPLVGGGAVLVEGEFPISERDWNQFMAVLAAMKPGLVRTDPIITDTE